MRILKKLLALSVTLILILGAASPLAFASESDDTELIEAEILEVRGGAEGIVSMTFDDGYYPTAVIVDRLAKEYGLTASLMMTSHSFNKSISEYAPLEVWKEFFKNSPLEPQSHTMQHLSQDDEQMQTEADFHREFAEWRETLEGYFPGHDVITLALPHGAVSDAALEYASKYYYAIRTTQYGVQTLDPGFSGNVGDWTQLYSPVVKMSTDDENVQFEYIKSCIDMNSNGWYAPIVHRVGDHEHSEMSEELTERVFAYIASLRDEGKVWVTTFSEATKYIRERQNSKAYYYTEGDGIYVKAELVSEYTEDGLFLDPEIFDTPLTVRVKVPDSYQKVYYTVRGVEYTAEINDDGTERYALVDVIPDGAAVRLRVNDSHDMGEFEKHDEENHKKVCRDCGLVTYFPHVPDGGTVTTPPEHMTEGVMTYYCTVCGEDSQEGIEKTTEHTFDCKVAKNKYLASIQSCTEGRKYFYSCECGAFGEETFYTTEPLGHEGVWRTVTEASEDEDGLESRRCTRCGVTEERAIPMTGGAEELPGGGGDTPEPPDVSGGGALAPEGDSTQDSPGEMETPTDGGDTQGDDNTAVIVIAAVCGGAVIIGASVGLTVVIRRKRPR